ncbi:hypothetical protein [Microbulbifer sp. ZKSA002]|uniref:hypothetical protein n=1 Tax=Microbulbifer sp. ZKSA002 TaxID=3243388 RepID=UPI0040398514
MKSIKSFVIFCTFFCGLISILFKLRDLENTQDIYLLLLVATLFGICVSAVIARKASFLLSSMPENEIWAAKSLFYVGVISFSISTSCVLNINYAKSETISSYEIKDKKYQERAGKSPEAWYISIDRQGETIELAVGRKDFKCYSIGDKLPVKEINGFFNWLVLLPNS